MDLITIFDLSNIILILLGLLTIVSSGFLSRYMNLYISFNISLTSIFVISFITASIITTLNQMRIVVLSFLFFVIFPWIISYVITWMFANDKTTLTRIKFAAFVGWWMGLIIISTIRLLFGWGYESIFALIVLGIMLSLINGIFSGILGNYLIVKYEKINPTA